MLLDNHNTQLSSPSETQQNWTLEVRMLQAAPHINVVTYTRTSHTADRQQSTEHACQHAAHECMRKHPITITPPTDCPESQARPRNQFHRAAMGGISHAHALIPPPAMSAQQHSIHLASWALRALSHLMLLLAATAGSRSIPSPAAHDCQHSASALAASSLATSTHGEDSATRRTHHPEASYLTRMLTLRARATSQHNHSPPCSITRRSTGQP